MFKNNINAEYKGIRIDNVATKVLGAVAGEKGKVVGQVIDKATKRITIKID